MSKLSLLLKGTVASVLFLGFCNWSQAQPGRGQVAEKSTVVAGVATSTTPTTRKKYTGSIDPIEQVESVARISGDLTVAPDFKEGSFVEKGQLLFEIDPIRYEANVKVAEATIEQYKARIAYAQTNYQRESELYKKNAGSQDDSENALSNLRSLEAQLASAEAQLVLAKDDLKYTKIYSMISGRVGRVTYTTGNYVTATSKALVTVVQTNPIYVCFSMSERDFTSMFGCVETLKKCATIELKLANDEIYQEPGQISFINNEVKTTTDTIKVWATFKNDAGLLNPGGVVTVNLNKRDENATAAVKPSAVMFDGSKYFVYILTDAISNDDLFAEILADSRFAAEKEAYEKGEKTQDDILKEFVKRYDVLDPKTQKVVSVDFKDGKVVDPKYKMVLRRDVEIGSVDGNVQSVYKGINEGDLVVMDGTHKAKPFELVRPISRDSETAEAAPVAPQTPKATKAAPEKNAAPKTASKTDSKTDSQRSPKRVAAKKSPSSLLARWIQGAAE